MEHKAQMLCSLSELCLAGYFAARTAGAAMWGAISAVGAVATEIVGTGFQHVGQLVPASVLGTSALGTPAPPTRTGTPLFEHREAPSFRAAAMNSGGGAAFLGGKTPYSSTAFVTFKSVQAACLACQVVLDEDAVVGSALVAEQAPEPRDIVWTNASKPLGQGLVRRFFVEVALLFGVAFWSVPVSLLQAWCSVDRLQKLLPWLEIPLNLMRSDFYALMTLYLPVMALLGLLELLPLVLHFLGFRYEGFKSWSTLQMMTMRRYWRFQLATIVVTALASSIWDSLKTVMDHPASILWQLGQSLPKAAVYFLATVLSSALVMGPVSLLRPTVLLSWLTRWLSRRLWRATCRWCCCRRRPSQPESCNASEPEPDTPDLAADLSSLLFVLLVCVTYSTLAPLITLAGLVFFVVRWGVLSVRYLYVHVPRFDSGGAFWYLLWDQALLALVLGNLTTLAVVGLRAGYAQLPFLLPLPLLPMGFKLRAEFRFEGPSRRLSLKWARKLDQEDPTLSDRFDSQAYWHPALRIAESELFTGHRVQIERERSGLGSVRERISAMTPPISRSCTLETSDM